MASNPQTAVVTLDDFIAAVERSDERLEFVGGRIVAMGGTSIDHAVITQNAARVLGNQLAGRGCTVVSQGTLVSAAPNDDTFLPDVAVYCGEPRLDRVRGVDLLLNPVLLVEVLSPSTADYDHGQKWENYRRIPTLQDYLLVSQDRRRVERYSRRGDGFWLFSETMGMDRELQLDELGVTLSLADIYHGVLSAERDAG